MTIDKEILEEVERLISKEAAQEPQEDNVDKYWNTFKRFLKILENAQEALREAQDCSYALGDSAIKERIAEVAKSFQTIYDEVDVERDKINRIRYKPITLKPTEDEIIKEEINKEVKPFVNTEDSDNLF